MGSSSLGLLPTMVIAILVVLSVLASSVYGARRVRSLEDLAKVHSEMGYIKRSSNSNSVKSQLNLPGPTGVKAEDKLVSAQGTRKKKFRETHKGYQIYNTGIDVEQGANGRNHIVSLHVYSDLEADLSGKFDCVLSHATAEDITLRFFHMKSATVEDKHFSHWIYVDDKDVAHVTVKVELFVVTKHGDMARPHAFIEKCDKTVLEAYDHGGFRTSTRNVHDREVEDSADEDNGDQTTTLSPDDDTDYFECDSDLVAKAGNPKRPITFGPSAKHCLDYIRRSEDGKTCYLENQYIKGVDLKNSDNTSKTEIASFVCSEGYKDEKNGGYSPMLDVFYFGTQSAKFYEDLYDFSPLGNPVPYAKAHFKTNLVNAYWDGRSLVFGDGDGTQFYPITNLDTVAHEYAHGVIQTGSNLAYRDQSGGISEAFSDMAGEATEEFLFDSTDWLSGQELFVKPGKALRYFKNPADDGKSIKHVKDYVDGMDVHYSSGIYNHVFWRMSKAMDVLYAFECFLIANRLYWREAETFESAACGTMMGAYDAGFDMEVVEDAFIAVGVTFKDCPDFSTLISAELTEGTQQTGLTVSQKKNPTFKVVVPAGMTKVTVTGTQGCYVGISTSYKRSEKTLAEGSGTATATVTSGQTVYARFFRGKFASKEVKGVAASVKFS